MVGKGERRGGSLIVWRLVALAEYLPLIEIVTPRRMEV
jgi:hypothetical protein